MKKLWAAVLVIVLLLGALLVFYTQKKEPVPTEETVSWQEQYDLGVRYLSDGNYEEAILAFTAAIEIDPRQADSYLMLAETYIAQNDFDSALKILEDAAEVLDDERITKKIEEINSGNIRDYWGNIRKTSHFDGEGNLVWVHETFYDSTRRISSVSSYDSAGNETSRVDYEYNEAGKNIVGSSYFTDSGILIRLEHESDSSGRMIKSAYYDVDTGSLMHYEMDAYYDNGLRSRTDFYNASGVMYMYSTQFYDSNNRRSRSEDFVLSGDGSEFVLNYCWLFWYNEDGNVVLKECYSSEDTLLSMDVYVYDAAGKLESVVTYGADGNVMSTETYS